MNGTMKHVFNMSVHIDFTNNLCQSVIMLGLFAVLTIRGLSLKKGFSAPEAGLYP